LTTVKDWRVYCHLFDEDNHKMRIMKILKKICGRFHFPEQCELFHADWSLPLQIIPWNWFQLFRLTVQQANDESFGKTI
jgi:hypothetical protein